MTRQFRPLAVAYCSKLLNVMYGFLFYVLRPGPDTATLDKENP
ncbi:hypothetical protein CPTD_00948 [Corynebacterium pseudotuberculosis]|nr:hypothetical protein CPTD_00948 [Corynebacterium pseudotuberculosis]